MIFLNYFRDLNKLEDGLGEKVSMFITMQVAFLSCLILALVRGWELALICLTSLPVTLVAIGIVAYVLQPPQIAVQIYIDRVSSF